VIAPPPAGVPLAARAIACRRRSRGLRRDIDAPHASFSTGENRRVSAVGDAHATLASESPDPDSSE